MRNGYKVYDSNIHIRPGADTLEKYLSARVRELVPDLESRFPGSVDLALSWKEIDPDLMQKILWDNAIKAFGEP